MMFVNTRANEVRDRIMKRKNNHLKNLQSENTLVKKLNFQYGDVEFSKEKISVNKELESSSFFTRLFISIIFVSIVAIIFQLQQFTSVQSKITSMMENEFKFAVVSNWYESQFGEPLTFFEEKNVMDKENDVIQTSGKVLENFQTNGQGILVETTLMKVNSFGDGLVIYAGEKDGLGNTVIVQNVDGSETWYGNLETINVQVYDDVKKGDELAIALQEESSEYGTYYLAMKKDNEFIDPNQVIVFE